MAVSEELPAHLPATPVWVRLWFSRTKRTDWIIGISEKREGPIDQMFRASRLTHFVPTTTETQAEYEIAGIAEARIIARGVITHTTGWDFEVRKATTQED